MSRPSRFDEPGAWHHLANRGLAQRAAFEGPADVRLFLAGVARAVRRGELELHAYSIRRRRFDLLVRSPAGELSEGTRRVENDYVRRFNRARGRDGPLFVQRFRSQRIDSELGRLMVLRFIDAHAQEEDGAWTGARSRLDCSALLQASTSAPRWLERSWVQAVVRELSGCQLHQPAAYPFVLPPATPALLELVERRLAGPRGDADPFDELVRDPAGELLRLLRERAVRSPSSVTPLCVCDTASVRAALVREAALCGAWSACFGGQEVDLWSQLLTALLRDLVGMTYAEAANIARCSSSGAVKHHQRHGRLLVADEIYAERAGRIAAAAFLRCVAGTGALPLAGPALEAGGRRCERSRGVANLS